MKIESVNISVAKGTIKTPVPAVTVAATGIVGDAHAAAWHRQISLLSLESIRRFSQESGRACQPGEFAENLTISGLDLGQVAIRDRLTIGGVELEVTQIGKTCHGDNCAIYREVGKCVMPKEGIFCRVVTGGSIKPGDELSYQPRPLRILVITLSDRASCGEYEDRSGPAVRQALETYLAPTRWRPAITGVILPDHPEELRARIQSAVAEQVDLIFTTGSTGIGPRDIAPETIRPMLTREIPGIMEFIRVKYGEDMPSALLSRSLAGVLDQTTLVYALPGSVKAVQQYMAEILPTLQHSLLMLWNIDAH